MMELESLAMHLQRECEQLNEVVIEQRAALDALKQTVEQLQNQVPQLTDEKDLPHERPPHY